MYPAARSSARMPDVERDLPGLARRMDPRLSGAEVPDRRERRALAALAPLVLIHTALLIVALRNVLSLDGDVSTGRWFALGAVLAGLGLLWVARGRGATWTWSTASLWIGVTLALGLIAWLEAVAEEPFTFLHFKDLWYMMVSCLSVLPVGAGIAAARGLEQAADAEGQAGLAWKTYAVASFLLPIPVAATAAALPIRGLAEWPYSWLYWLFALGVMTLLREEKISEEAADRIERATLSVLGVVMTLLPAYVLWRAPDLHQQVHEALQPVVPGVQVVSVAVILALTAYLARSSRRPV